ncbi:MAG: alpha/beta hydrolase [Oscillospiraceae bacterium]|nr:alpha/beta hydrolase [Oscillospiraceae bacterium]
MNVVKKILKGIAVALCVLLILLILLVAGLFIYHRIMIPKNRAFLQENGFCELASAGDYSLNVQKTGNADGKHRIIVLSGAGPCYRFFMKDFAAQFQADNEVIFLSRPGYDGSDDTKEAMTVERVVESYRTALENAGVEKPYLLMPHSLGSLYASYWVSKYPDEIEAVANLDGTYPAPVADPQPQGGKDMFYYLANLGVGDVAFHAFIPKDPNLSADEQRAYDIMYLSTIASDALCSEGEHIDVNKNAAWEALTPNDVPKMYLSFRDAYRTVEEAQAYFDESGYKEELIAFYSEDFTGSDTDREAYACQKYLDEVTEHRSQELEPFAEKLGNCEIRYLPGSHFLYEDKPEECAAIVQDFLNGLDG